MKYALLLTMLLAACAPQEHDITPEAGPQAGSVALNTEALAPPAYCNTIEAYSRTWLDSQTPGSLVCAGAVTDAYWACNTSSPPITYSVNKTQLGYSGTFCEVTRRVVPSQSSTWQYRCRIANPSGTKTCTRL